MKKLIPVVMFALLALQGIANAAVIEGKVASIDKPNAKFTLAYTDAEGAEVTSEVSVKIETVYTGLASFEDLGIGQEVTIEATEEPGGAFGAVSVVATEKVKEALEELSEKIEAQKQEVPVEETSAY